MGLALMKSNSEKEDKYMPTAVLSKRELKKKKKEWKDRHMTIHRHVNWRSTSVGRVDENNSFCKICVLK